MGIQRAAISQKQTHMKIAQPGLHRRRTVISRPAMGQGKADFACS